MSMSTRTVVGGALLLGTSMLACGSSPQAAPQPKRLVPIATMAATAETTAATGITKWELYHAKRAQGASSAFEVVARGAQDHVVRALKVSVLSETHIKKKQWISNAPHLIIDGKKGTILESTLTIGALETHQRLGRDSAIHAKSQEYGCFGDIFWAIGGFIVSVPTCAAIVPSLAIAPITPGAVALCVGAVIGGPVAGIVSAIEDCTPPPPPPPPPTVVGQDDPPPDDEYSVQVALEEDYSWTGDDGSSGDYGGYGGSYG